MRLTQPEIELWGGHECTVNRVGDRYFDQTELTGHEQRPNDLDLFAALGVKSLRYPLLWERIAPDQPDRHEWHWTDERLARLRALNISVIAGLVHHGSGPRYTNLLDESFAPGLAFHARAVVERYPWIEDWTPINEPLTTARFSALYGHWYPHRREEAAFWLALLNQIDATRAAMAEIRAINPAARLIQTEDLGKTYSTRAVAHQATHDNARRWMTWDLLCGHVDRDHFLFERISRFGLGDRLRAIADAPCPPDIIGVNHYLTSDRFLDHRVEQYPPDRHGANEFMSYADVEAVRVILPAPGGLEERLDEAWRRYGVPLAVTECHNGCTREDQLRWLRDAWDSAIALRQRGVDIRAVTAWSLLGACGWNRLLTDCPGDYEPGAFDVRQGEPRPTATARLIKALATGQPNPAAADGTGWWKRDIRLQFAPVFRTVDHPEAPRAQRTAPSTGRPLLITGATGVLGKALARACEWRGLDYVLTDRAQLDLTDIRSINIALERHQPWAVINAAGWALVDRAEAHPQECAAANAAGCARLAQACARDRVAFAGISSHLVFDGAGSRPYVESDATSPLNAYGRSKANAEAAVMAADGLMVRTSAFFSPYDPHNFAARVARSLARGQQILAARDGRLSPTYLPDLIDGLLDLVIDGERGLWHLANQGETSWAAFGQRIAATLSLDPALVVGVDSQTLGLKAARPVYSVLSSDRGLILPTLDSALDRYGAMMIASAFEAEIEVCAAEVVSA